MFVYSIKSSKVKLLAILLVVALAVGAVLYFGGEEKPAGSDGALSLKAGDAAERATFLSQFGWEVQADPVQVAEVIIPVEFDETYLTYNEIQKAQNLDLEPYQGKRCKRWTFEVKNYPGYENSAGLIQANILVYDGMVIGGDVCSLAPDGFLQGFDFPDERAGTTQTGTAPAGTTQASTAKQAS